MCGEVAVLIYVAANDGWRHPAVCHNEVNSAFLGILVRMARGSSGLPVAFAFIIAYV